MSADRTMYAREFSVKKYLSTIAAVLLLIAPLGFQTGQAGALSSHIRPVEKPFPAHPFKLRDLDDKWVTLADMKGKTVIINFWATWCPPCRRELPSMQRTYAKYKDRGLVILGINVGESWYTIAPFLSPFNIQFPILLDTDSSVMNTWKAVGLPTSYVINKEGVVTHRITGGRDWDDPVFRQDLENILAGKP